MFAALSTEAVEGPNQLKRFWSKELQNKNAVVTFVHEIMDQVYSPIERIVCIFEPKLEILKVQTPVVLIFIIRGENLHLSANLL